MRKTVLAVATVLMLGACSSYGPPPQSEATVAQVMTKFGLMGHMAADCSTPFGPGHSRYRALPDGRVEVTAYISAGFGRLRTTPNVMIIDRARPEGPDKMQTRTTDNGNGQVFITGWDRQDGAFKLMRSYRPDGTAYFTNGVDGMYEYKWVRPCPN